MIDAIKAGGTFQLNRFGDAPEPFRFNAMVPLPSVCDVFMGMLHGAVLAKSNQAFCVATCQCLLRMCSRVKQEAAIEANDSHEDVRGSHGSSMLSSGRVEVSERPIKSTGVEVSEASRCASCVWATTRPRRGPKPLLRVFRT